jgi:hypothetical protein
MWQWVEYRYRVSIIISKVDMNIVDLCLNMYRIMSINVLIYLNDCIYIEINVFF